LTIPSLEMPSTLGLDSKDKLAIMMGFECCWDQKLIKAVQTEHLLKSTEYWSKVNPKKSQFTLQPPREPAHWSTWATFLTLQALDIYSTKKGMEWDCVQELNPLLPEIPTVADMVVLKTAVLVPIYGGLHYTHTLTDEDFIIPSMLVGVVVINNFKVIERAKKNCQKR